MYTNTITFPSEEIATNRDGFGQGLLEAGKKNPNVWVLTADLSESTRVHWFAKEFPDRFVDVGVAEQNLVTIASGIAAAGKIPVATSYATFSPGRNWEQIRTTICYNNQPVVIASSHAGLSVGPDGATHQGLEDIALMRVLPNMTVIVPADSNQARSAILASIEHPRPTYIRLSREKSPVFTPLEIPFEVGRADVLRLGNDVTLVASGPIVYEALLAAEALVMDEISVEVINLSTIKPLDTETLLTSAEKTKRVVTLEDHQIAGGMGGAVSELLSERLPTRIIRIGANDRFGQSGSIEQLYKEYGLDVESIVHTVKGIVA